MKTHTGQGSSAGGQAPGTPGARSTVTALPDFRWPVDEGPERRAGDEGQVGLDDEHVPAGIGPEDAPRREHGPAGSRPAFSRTTSVPRLESGPQILGRPGAGHDHGPERLDGADGAGDEPEHRRPEDGVEGLRGPGTETGILPPGQDQDDRIRWS